MKKVILIGILALLSACELTGSDLTEEQVDTLPEVEKYCYTTTDSDSSFYNNGFKINKKLAPSSKIIMKKGSRVDSTLKGPMIYDFRKRDSVIAWTVDLDSLQEEVESFGPTEKEYELKHWHFKNDFRDYNII